MSDLYQNQETVCCWRELVLWRVMRERTKMSQQITFTSHTIEPQINRKRNPSWKKRSLYFIPSGVKLLDASILSTLRVEVTVSRRSGHLSGHIDFLRIYQQLSDFANLQRKEFCVKWNHTNTPASVLTWFINTVSPGVTWQQHFLEILKESLKPKKDQNHHDITTRSDRKLHSEPWSLLWSLRCFM